MHTQTHTHTGKDPAHSISLLAIRFVLLSFEPAIHLIFINGTKSQHEIVTQLRDGS